MRAVILQPMYLPWMGYFGMIDQADVFVYYDDVQFVRRSWQRRNRIKVPDGEFTWLTVPIEKDFGQQINEVKIKNNSDWKNKHRKSIKHSYSSTPHFEEYVKRLYATLETDRDMLVDLNTALIKQIVDMLGIKDTKFVFSSELGASGSKTDRLLSILNNLNADLYISGPGAKDYIDISKFEQEGIDLYWHEFNHPEYSQPHGEFVSHLSVIDLLFNTGEEALEIIREGEQDALKKATLSET